MSDFSSLILFYPGKPPALGLGGLRRFCDRLRDTVATGGKDRVVKLKYGQSADQDFEPIIRMDGLSEHSAQTRECEWDHHKQGVWGELWPAETADEARQIYRGHVGLGNLPPKVSRGLTARKSQDAVDELIAPDTLSLKIDPVCPCTLETEELTAYGLLEVSFSGDGFFSWQPLERYWKQVGGLTVLKRVQAVCREDFPVPPLDFLEPLKQDMGALFLNRDSYQPGDWIVSVSETG